MFKPGDKAWHPQYGWGRIESTGNGNFPIKFVYQDALGQSEVGAFLSSGKRLESDLNPVIFHKEQKFDLSEPEPEIGTWGYFWEKETDKVIAFSRFDGIKESGSDEYYLDAHGGAWDNFYPSLPQHIKDMMEGKG